MRKRIFIPTDSSEGIDKEVFMRDYTPSLTQCMARDEDNFWQSQGIPVQLDTYDVTKLFYRKAWVDVPPKPRTDDKRYTVVRSKVNQDGLEVIACLPQENAPSPTIVICLGGPAVSPPDVFEKDSIYSFLMQSGYALIIPLRRGMNGISQEWEKALEGHYGVYDVMDTVEATRYVCARYPQTIDSNRLFLYGGSYGGYVAALIAGKANGDRLFKAVISHCGVYDLGTYPWHNSGIPKETMMTYGGTMDETEYVKNVSEISPKTYVSEWNVPVLLIHHLSDTSSWFGQSVMAYNDALQMGKQVQLLLVPGPHGYDISSRKQLFEKIVTFFANSLQTISTTVQHGGLE